ncbi:Uncharacterised protein [Tsukamurella pulmonis]|nr:Uncharacterised protein [Tsukamurella pulmonis]
MVGVGCKDGGCVIAGEACDFIAALCQQSAEEATAGPRFLDEGAEAE